MKRLEVPNSILGLCAITMTVFACGDAADSPTAPNPQAPHPTSQTLEVPSIVHLADALSRADVSSAEPPAAAKRKHTWTVAQLRDQWRKVSSADDPALAEVEIEATEQAVRLSLARPLKKEGPLWIGGLAVDVSDLRLNDWETLLVRARSSDRFAGIMVSYNLDEEGALPTWRPFFMSPDLAPPVFSDGSEQTYAIPLRGREGAAPETALTSIGVFFASLGAASVDITSIELVPRGADFLEPAGVRAVTRGGTTRNTLFAHAPLRIGWPLAAAPDRRLDFGLTTIEGEEVTYRVRVEHGGSSDLLFEETIHDSEVWHQRSVELPADVTPPAVLSLEAQSESEGAVALWGAPILSRNPPSNDPARPNVIFYVIDGGDANLMSAFGYERTTTPFLEKLAKEGVLFTRAHSNSTWTQPSTVSFMTSLQHSVLGGLRRGVHSTSVPTEATTFAEHFRAAGYQTASFTANPNAGRIIGMERGMDLMRDVETEHHSTSSLELQEELWRFRDSYPGTPYWVHIQTTDVHEPNQPEAPFAGRFASPEQREQLATWDEQIQSSTGPGIGSTSIAAYYDDALARLGIDRQAYFGTRRDLYDETMLHQDHALEQLVTELKERGEWQNTLLVIGSDHGHPAGTFARFGRGLFDPQPEPWQGALFDAYATRIPLLVVWPGQLEGGRIIEAPVSMIDVLPTVLDLVGLPQPDTLQGQSLAPLLRGNEMQVRPVILDEFRVDEATGEMIGNLEIIDGRWGASLEIAPVAEDADATLGRHSVPAGGRWGVVHPLFEDVPRLLLYDLENDPFALRAVNADHPELVTRYTALLLERWQAHRSLAQKFEDSEAAPLSPEQLEQLRILGYID